jgi:hypothetical protein
MLVLDIFFRSDFYLEVPFLSESDLLLLRWLTLSKTKSPFLLVLLLLLLLPDLWRRLLG